MNRHYQDATLQLQIQVDTCVEQLRASFQAEGLDVSRIPPASMRVELLANLLIQALASERLQQAPGADPQQIQKHAAHAVQMAVVTYRNEPPADGSTLKH